MSTSKAEKIRLPDKEFLNVEYPGRVNNVDKALNNIGGINSLTKVRTTSYSNDTATTV
jgi:hypothetical protein